MIDSVNINYGETNLNRMDPGFYQLLAKYHYITRYTPQARKRYKEKETKQTNRQNEKNAFYTIAWPQHLKQTRYTDRETEINKTKRQSNKQTKRQTNDWLTDWQIIKPTLVLLQLPERIREINWWCRGTPSDRHRVMLPRWRRQRPSNIHPKKRFGKDMSNVTREKWNQLFPSVGLASWRHACNSSWIY